MTVALYCRVSTDEQAQHGFSIDHQKERLEAYARSQGWDDFEFYVDDGYTGTKLERPQMQRLLRHVKNGRISTVVVYKLDRLSRKQKDVLHLLEDVFEANGVAFKSATEPFDTSTPLGKAMIGILAVFAQLERDTIVERTKSGKHQRVRQGMWYGGPTPYGYDWSVSNQELVIVATQAQLVREMFTQLVKGKSYLAIGKWMDARTKERLFSSHKTLIYMLTNPLYAGKLNQDGLLIEGKHQAIIDDDLWTRAQLEIESRKAGRNPYGSYLLSNLLVCGTCGKNMKHVMYRKNPSSGNSYMHGYYLCAAKHRKGTDCPSKYQPDSKLETQVSERLRDLALEPARVRAEIVIAQDDVPNNDNLIDDLTSQLDEINDKLARWYDAFERGDIDSALVKARVSGLEDEKRAILLRLDEMEEPDKENRVETILDSLEIIGQEWDDLTDDERAIVLRAAVRKITVNADGTLLFDWCI